VLHTQDCRQPVSAPARSKRGVDDDDDDETNEAMTSTTDDDDDDDDEEDEEEEAGQWTKTIRDANASLTVWYPSELIHRRTGEIRQRSRHAHLTPSHLT